MSDTVSATEAWELLQRLMMNVSRPRFVELCARYDVTPPQLLTLRHLEVEKPMSMSDVAKLLKCDASNVTGIVDRLETRGLVERRSAPGDRRVKILALTEDGARMREELIARLAEPPAELVALSERDQRELRDILRRALG